MKAERGSVKYPAPTLSVSYLFTDINGRLAGTIEGDSAREVLHHLAAMATEDQAKMILARIGTLGHS